MIRRTLTALLLLALLLPAVYFGGIAYFLFVAAFMGTAAWEYSQMFRLRAFRPASALTIGAVLLVLAARAFQPDDAEIVLTASILVAMLFHLSSFERGRNDAAVDLTITLAGIAYLGWVAGYLIDLRQLPYGAWWLMLVLIVVWIADSAAYFVGVRLGRHKMLPRLSPKKSWEGYAAGVVVGTTLAGLLSRLFSQFGPIELSVWQGLSLGFVLSALTTLGDLSESLFKRFAGIKDSGAFLPGHGGAFDRIDSLIWAGVLGYYWIRFLLL
jgi:phosphatidate cytidylyltransferase